MIKITDKQKLILKQYFNNLDELLVKDDIQVFLDRIDDIIVDNIIDNDDEPNEEGIILQRIYDQIFNQN